MDTVVHDLTEDARKLQVQLDDVWLENAKLRNECAALRAALQNMLTTQEAEAKAANSLRIAVENFTDSEPDYQAHINALVACSNADAAARALVEAE